MCTSSATSLVLSCVFTYFCFNTLYLRPRHLSQYVSHIGDLLGLMLTLMHVYRNVVSPGSWSILAISSHAFSFISLSWYDSCDTSYKHLCSCYSSTSLHSMSLVQVIFAMLKKFALAASALPGCLEKIIQQVFRSPLLYPPGSVLIGWGAPMPPRAGIKFQTCLMSLECLQLLCSSSLSSWWAHRSGLSTFHT